MRLKLLFIVTAIFVLTVSSSFAAVTSQITGTVTDKANGEPLIGVTVAVQGTSLGAISDVDGRYTILNVPVGTYTIVFSAVGYATVEVSNVSVSADIARKLDQPLTSTTTELSQTIHVRAETPLVEPDKTTTITVVKKEEVQALPTRGFDQVVGIQNSVVRKPSSNVTQRQRGQREEVGSGVELNLRGGRPSEVAYYVDGFSQQDPLTGISTANIANNAIEEVSVQQGVFSAEYGHVASGIVNVTTVSGTSEYHGTAEAVTDNVMSSSFDQNFYSGDFGGPIPGLEKGNFFFSGERRWLGDRTPSSRTKDMIDVYGKPFGLDTLYSNPQRIPSNSLSGWSYQGKIDYPVSPNFKVLLSGNGSIDKWQEYRQEWLLNPLHAPRYEDKNVGLNAKVTHTLGANTFYNLSTSYFLTERWRGDGVVFKDLAATNRIFVNPEYEDQNLFWTNSEDLTVTPDSLIIQNGQIVGGYSRGQSFMLTQADSYDIDTTSSPGDTTVTAQFLNEPSYYGGYLHRKASYIGVKGDMTHQLSSSNTLKFGFDAQRHTLRFFQNLDATKGYLDTRVNRYGFDSLGNESDNENFKNDTKNPVNLGVYVQDRFEWAGLIINAGLRYDVFDYKALRLKNPVSPMDPDMSLQDTNPNNDSPNDNIIDPTDLEPSKTFSRVSPRLGISFPISEVTKMHINYGKFYQRPDLNKLFLGYDFLEARLTAGSYYPFPSPNLEPEKTTQYEVGFTHQFSYNTVLGITAYYKDVEDLTQIYHQSPAFPKEYDFYANTDYGTIKGVDFSFQMTRTHNISLDLKYTLSWANGTGSYPNSTYIIAWQNPTGTPSQTRPLDYDQRHNVTAIVDYRTGRKGGPEISGRHPLENFGVNFLITAASGTPYTPFQIYNELTEAAATPRPAGPINSARQPWYFSIDMKAEKNFNLGRYQVIPYLWVKNLLDRENILSVYESSGEADIVGWIQTPEGQVSARQNGTALYDLKQDNPTMYSNPRQILLGVRMTF